MGNKISIGSYAQNDLPELVSLINSAFRGEGSKKGWTTEADIITGSLRTDEDGLLTELHKEGATMLKATDNDLKILGCVYLQKRSKELYLGMMTVSPELQAAGIGKKLLTAAEEHAKAQKCNVITMRVVSIRSELIAWYLRHGYHNSGKTEPFPNHNKFGVPTQPLEFVILEKEIN